MEEPNQQPAKTFELIPLTAEQHPVSALPKRTTELPFFYLTKKKQLLQQNIQYEGIDEAGRPIRWTVRPNRDPEIGVPAIDAHEVWVRLIIPVIEHHRSHARIPEILPLGGVRQCLRMLGWGMGGHQARRLLRALNQIGAAWCEADFFLPITSPTGELKLVPIKGKFSRLSIYAIGENHLTGEQLAGGKFDFDFDLDATIYVQLHKMEIAIQDSQERRYIDNQYMFSVEPTGRRWLEIMAPKIFGVVKNNGSHCDIRYSWYVKQHHTLKRLYVPWRVTEQMNRVAEDHITSGYILKPEYRTVKEPDQEIDFIVRYKPGPMAGQSTSRIRSYLKKPAAAVLGAGERPARKPYQKKLSLQPTPEPQPPVIIDYGVVAELEKRGVSGTDARKLLAELQPGQPILDQLEYGDVQIEQSRGKITNPPGFYIYLLQKNIPVPATFETSKARKARQEAAEARQRAMESEQEASKLLEETEARNLTAQFEALHEASRLVLLAQVKAEQLARKPQMAYWFSTNSEANSFLLAGARTKLREGWRPPQPENPHYTINPPIGQATPLQETDTLPAPESSPVLTQHGGDFAAILEAFLSTPQLSPAVEQTTVEPEKPASTESQLS